MKHPIISEIADLLTPAAKFALYNDPAQWISEIIAQLEETGSYEIPSRYSKTRRPVPLFYTIDELEEVVNTVSQKDYRDEYLATYDEIYGDELE